MCSPELYFLSQIILLSLISVSKNNPEGNADVPFIPMFVVVKRSDYRDGQTSFVITNQESILSSYCDDYDVMTMM